MKFFFLVLLFVLPCTAADQLNLVELSPISPKIQALDGKFVQVRGFWYPISDDKGVLSPDSKLKSCCIGTTNKITQQIVIKRPFPNLKAGSLVNFEGVFKIKPLRNETMDFIQYYILEEAHQIHPTYKNSLILLLGFAIFLIYCLIRFKFQ